MLKLKTFGNFNGGLSLLGLLILLAAILFVASLLGFNIRKASENPIVQENASYVTQASVSIWDNYLSVPVNKAITWYRTYFWKIFVDNIGHIFRGEPTDVQIIGKNLKIIQ